MKKTLVAILIIYTSLALTNISFASENSNIKITDLVHCTNNSGITTVGNEMGILTIKEEFKYKNENTIQLLSEALTKQKETIYHLESEVKLLKSDRTDKESTNDEINYSVWASILLACVTVIVTVLGVVVAIISFFGFNHVKESAKQTATEISEIVAREQANTEINQVAKAEIARLLDSGELKEHLESAVDLIVRRNNSSNLIHGFEKYPELDEEEQDL